MLNDKKQYYYIDDYMYFTFAGVNSKKYNLFITNSKGFTKVVTAGASVQTEAPDYQNMAYYLGTTKSQKSIKIDVATQGLDYDNYKEMIHWLAEGNTGFLYLDTDIDWGWDVVVSKLGDVTYNPSCRGDVYEFNIQFDTIGTYKARSPWDTTIDLDKVFDNIITNDEDDEMETNYSDKTMSEKTIVNKWGIPELIFTGSIEEKTLYLPVVGNENSYFNYIYRSNSAESSLFVSQINYLSEETEYINYKFKHNIHDAYIKYYGNSNYVVYNDDSLVESVDDLIIETSVANQSNGLLQLNGQAPKKVQYISLTDNEIILTKEQADTISYMDDFYISISYFDFDEYARYNINGYSIKPYPYQFYNIILFDPEIIDNKITFNEQTWNRLLSSIPSNIKVKKPLIYYGNYNTVKINNIGGTGHLINLYKYNNL